MRKSKGKKGGKKPETDNEEPRKVEDAENGDASNEASDEQSNDEIAETEKDTKRKRKKSGGGKKAAKKSKVAKSSGTEEGSSSGSAKKKTNKKVKEESADESSEGEESTTEYEVEKIIDVFFKKGGKKEFLVRWKGYSAKEDTWEPESNLNCNELISALLEKCEKARSMEPRETRVSRKKTERYTVHTQEIGRKLSGRHKGKPRKTYNEDD